MAVAVKQESFYLMRHAKIKIILIGTEGQLDRPEEQFAVMYGEDQANNAKRHILEIFKNNPEYKEFGWTMLSAHKIFTIKPKTKPAAQEKPKAPSL